MAKPPLADDQNRHALAKTKPLQRAKPPPSHTRVSPGAVPPAAAPPPVPMPAEAANDDHGSTATLGRQPDRSSRIGTQLHGTEGLAAPGAEAPKLRLTAGKIVPGTRYRILRWIGEGGMGVVYEAEHVDIERRVALKILRFDLSKQPRMVQVFRDEAKAASRLGSEYLIDIYDFGELADGRLFFAMEFLDGRDLVPSDETAAMEPERVVSILRQVAKGLHVAHLAGVVHRDVKPENIITIRSGGRSDAVKIVDFGISAMLAAGPSHESGGIAGTPHYMAPEQILGDPFDGRLDVYALGCTAYELMTGQPPFDAETVEELLHKQLSEAAPRPSELRPDLAIPRPLEDVIMHCLEKGAAQRYADMADFEAALCEAQIASGLQTPWDDLPLPELPDPERRDRILREMPSVLDVPPGRQRSWLWPVIAAVSSLAAVGLGLFLAFGRGPTDEDKTAVEQIVIEARDAAAKSNWIVPPPGDPKLPTAFRKVIELEAVEGSAEDLADEKGEELRGEFASSLVTYGDKLWDAGATRLAREYYWWALTFDEDNDHAYERSGATPGALRDFIVRARKGDFYDAELVMGRALAAQSQEDEAARQKLLDEALAAAQDKQLAGQTHLLLDDAAKQAGVRLSRRDDAVAMAQPSEEEMAPEPEVLEIEEPTEEDSGTGGDQEADKSSHRRRRRSAPVLGSAQRDPAKAEALAREGKAALRSGRRQEAASLFHQAISFDRKNGTALMGLSDVYFDTGSNQKAVVYAEKAVSASPANSTARLKLGDAYYKVLRYKDALEQYHKAKKLGSGRAQERITKVEAKLGN